jgi:hypothetical protein
MLMKSEIIEKGKDRGGNKKERNRKGGRPKVAEKRDESLTVMCNIFEKRVIQANATRAGMTVSVFLRRYGLSGKMEVKIKAMPRGVLHLTGTLNHVAANLNQIARKRNKGEDLDALERALLNKEVRNLQELSMEIKAHLLWSEK